jgi:hypothetical protein
MTVEKNIKIKNNIHEFTEKYGLKIITENIWGTKNKIWDNYGTKNIFNSILF